MKWWCTRFDQESVAVCGAMRYATHHPSWPIQGAVLDRRPVPPVCLAKTKRANRSNVYPRSNQEGGQVRAWWFAAVILNEWNCLNEAAFWYCYCCLDVRVSPILNLSSTPSLARRDQLRLLKALDPNKFSDGLRPSIAKGCTESELAIAFWFQGV